MVPLGTNRALSIPYKLATRLSSNIVVWSSPYTSSPTMASAMAVLMPLQGEVTVSLLMSTVFEAFELLDMFPYRRQANPSTAGLLALPAMAADQLYCDGFLSIGTNTTIVTSRITTGFVN